MDSRRWQGYRARPGDIVIATYPKCGTTWMQRIVGLLVFQSPEPKPVTAISPWLDARFIVKVEEPLAIIEQQSHRRFLKSHLPLDALPFLEEVRYIHVARDGLDAFMSWHNHSLRYKRPYLLDEAGLADETIARPYPRAPEAPRDFFRDWIGLSGSDKQSDVSADAFFDTERTYWNARREPNVLLVHYNDLTANLDREMRRIADFLHISTPPGLWPDLVNAATFDTMKRDGQALMPHAGAAFEGGHDGFIHSGRNERWRNALAPEDIAHYRARAAKELPPALNAWLERGRGQTDPRTLAD
jgi:aryl sulfotransferase